MGWFFGYKRSTYTRVNTVVYFVMSCQCSICPWNKHKQWEISNSINFFPFQSLRAMIIKKEYSVQSSAIFWVTYVVTSKTDTQIRYAVSLSVCACFMREWNPEMTSQSKLDPFYCIAVHGPKKCPTSLLWKGTTSEGKINAGAKTFFTKVVRAVAKVY